MPSIQEKPFIGGSGEVNKASSQPLSTLQGSKLEKTVLNDKKSSSIRGTHEKLHSGILEKMFQKLNAEIINPEKRRDLSQN